MAKKYVKKYKLVYKPDGTILETTMTKKDAEKAKSSCIKQNKFFRGKIVIKKISGNKGKK